MSRCPLFSCLTPFQSLLIWLPVTINDDFFISFIQIAVRCFLFCFFSQLYFPDPLSPLYWLTVSFPTVLDRHSLCRYYVVHSTPITLQTIKFQSFYHPFYTYLIPLLLPELCTVFSLPPCHQVISTSFTSYIYHCNLPLFPLFSDICSCSSFVLFPGDSHLQLPHRW